MPKAPRRCTRPDCSQFVPCPVHGTVKWANSNSPPLPSNWGALVREVKRRDSCVCRYCGVRSVDGQVDHKINRAEGGTHHLDNLQWLCTECHKKKTEMEKERGNQRGQRGRRR